VAGNSEARQVIRSSSFAAKPMTVEEAVQEVDTSNSEFIVFRNAESERVSVVYRRRDGNSASSSLNRSQRAPGLLFVSISELMNPSLKIGQNTFRHHHWIKRLRKRNGAQSV
jgi:hypothetical protein